MRTYHIPEWVAVVRVLAIRIMENITELMFDAMNKYNDLDHHGRLPLDKQTKVWYNIVCWAKKVPLKQISE